MRNINWLGLPVAIICSAVSLGLIADYAMGASDNPWRMAVYGAVGVAGVLWETTGLHRGDHLRQQKRIGAAALCYGGLAMAILITVSFEIGSLAEIMESKASIGESRAGERAALEAEREILMGQARKTGAVRPVAAIQGDIDAIKAHPRWTSTGGCANVTAPESKDICIAYGKLAAEIGAATAIGTATARIVDLNGKLQPLAAAKIADARASYLSKLSGLPEIDSRIAVSLLVIAFLLFGRVAGGYVFMDSREHGANQIAGNANTSPSPTRPRTAAFAFSGTQLAQNPVFLPPLASLDMLEDDFDDGGLTLEEIEAEWDIQREREMRAELSAGRAVVPVAAPLAAEHDPVIAEPIRLSPVDVARREIVRRYCDDCLTFHGNAQDETGSGYHHREMASLIWEGFNTWRSDVEIEEEMSRPIFGKTFLAILTDKGGLRLKSDLMCYLGVTMKPAHAHRVARAAAAIEAGKEDPMNRDDAVSPDGPRRLGAVLRDRRGIAGGTDARVLAASPLDA